MATRKSAGTETGARALTALLLLLASCRGQEASPVRSAILVTIDTLRADHVSAYGYSRLTTPHLDELFARGTRFENAFATSCRTAPSHASMLTGLYPSFLTIDIENGVYPLHEGHTTLAEICQDAGLSTVAIVSNPVLGRNLGLGQGFEVYRDEMPVTEANRSFGERRAADTVDLALSALEDLKDRRFLLWIHFQDPHGPYDAPGEHPFASADIPGPELPLGDDQSGFGALPLYQRRGDETRLGAYVLAYDAEIRYLDHHLGRLLDSLKTSGLGTTTMVAITADHGEAFGEEGWYCAHGHGTGLDQTHVPLGFVGPGVARGRVLRRAVSNLDVFATLLETLGLEAPGGAQSRSLLASLRAGEEPDDIPGFSESATQRASFCGNVYLREDRAPLSDREFWARGNPFTGAPFVPLGKTLIDPLEGAQEETTDRDVKTARDALLRFSSRADVARSELDAIRRSARPLGDDEREKLRRLGYLR
jgi:arylsulfatase